MDVLSLILYILCVHEQGLTQLNHNQYKGMPLIQATERQSCGIRFGKNCKTTMPSSGWYMVLHQAEQTIDVLPHIPHVLWMYLQGLTRMMGHN